MYATTLNGTRVGFLDRTTQNSMHKVISYFASPNEQQEMQSVPSLEEVEQAFRQINSISPDLLQTMAQCYSVNPKTHDRLAELTARMVAQQPLPLIPPQDNSLSVESCVNCRLYLGKFSFSLGPAFKHNFRSGKSRMGVKFTSSFDSANEQGNTGFGGSWSLSKGNVKATGFVDKNLSQSSVTVQTNTSSHVNVGIKVNSTDTPLFAYSNVVKNGRFVVLHKNNAGDIETTGCVLPFQTIKNKARRHSTHRKPARRHSTHKKQIKNQPTSTETRVHKRELVQQIHLPEPVYTIRARGGIAKLSLLAILSCLFVLFVSRLVSFLKNKRVK